MREYTPRKITPLRILAMLLRGIGLLITGLARMWLLIAVIAFLVSPVGPHLRMQYRYVQVGGTKYYSNCDYFGSRGWVRNQQFDNCPMVVFIDSRKYRRF